METNPTAPTNSDITPAPKPRSSRKSAPKVKTGCITCKIRHVKCDETRPDCQRCTSTGRKCDGYEHKKGPKAKDRARSFSVAPITTTTTTITTPTSITSSPPANFSSSPLPVVPLQQNGSLNLAPNPLPVLRRASFAFGQRSQSSSPPTIFLNPSLNLNTNPLEKRALDFFLKNTGPMLSNRFKASFWTEMLPRIAATEDCVMHAAMAIASLHEQQLNELEPAPQLGLPMSLVQYNKAIALLRKRLMSPLKGDREVTVLTCLLFVCLELMQSKPERAFQHLQSGLKILTSLKLDSDRSPGSPGSSRSLELLEHTDEEIANTFSRLSIQQALTSGEHPPAEYCDIMVRMPSLSNHTPFRDVVEARDSLYDITVLSLRPDVNNPEKGVIPTNVPAPEFFEMRRQVIEQVGHWSSRLTHSMTTQFNQITTEDMHALRLLQLHSLLMLIWNETQLDWGNELAFDLQTDRFREMITLSQAINAYEKHRLSTANPAAPALNLTSKVFSLEMGPIYVLFVAAAKCRHPYIRREAAALLLEMTPQKEGVWDAQVMYGAAKRIIEIEEDGRLVTDDIRTWPTLTRCCWYHMDDVYDLEQRTQQVSLGWRPDPEAGLVVWQEIIHY